MIVNACHMRVMISRVSFDPSVSRFVVCCREVTVSTMRIRLGSVQWPQEVGIKTLLVLENFT